MSDLDVLKKVTEAIRGVLDSSYPKIAILGQTPYRVDIDIAVIDSRSDDRVGGNLRYFAKEVA